MHLDDIKNLLPPVLRDSKLPWVPDSEEQAPAIRDNDGWTASLGHLKFQLDVYWDSVYRFEGPSDEPVWFNLRLHNTAIDKELGYWEFPRLDIAAYVAETLHQERLDAVISSVNKQLQDAHDQAA